MDRFILSTCAFFLSTALQENVVALAGHPRPSWIVKRSAERFLKSCARKSLGRKNGTKMFCHVNTRGSIQQEV